MNTPEKILAAAFLDTAAAMRAALIEMPSKLTPVFVDLLMRCGGCWGEAETREWIAACNAAEVELVAVLEREIAKLREANVTRLN